MQALSFIPYRLLRHIVGALLVFGVLTGASAADDTPEAFIKRLSGDVIDAIKTDKSLAAGDINKVIVLVDQKVMPSVNFLRMTASARGWLECPSALAAIASRSSVEPLGAG